MNGRLTREIKHRINRRAHELSRQSYENYQIRMMEDSRIASGQILPEDWVPPEKQDLKK